MSTENAPARHYSWPPFRPGNDVGEQFEPGNTAARTHGANSMALVEPRARELGTRIFVVHTHLDIDRDADAVARLAMALARIERVYWWLSEQDDPIFSDPKKGKAHPIFERLERFEREARQAEAQLGMSPLARARLGLDAMEAKRRMASLDDFRGGDA